MQTTNTRRHVPANVQKPAARLFCHTLTREGFNRLSDDEKRVLGRACTVYSYTSKTALWRVRIFEGYRNGETVILRPEDVK